MTNEQKLREALQEALVTLRKASRGLTEQHKGVLNGKQWGQDTMRNIEEALSPQPTNDEGTPTIVWAGKEPTVEQLKELVERLERALHAKERELERIVDETERSSLCHCPPEDKCHGKHYAKKLRAALLGNNT